MSEELDFNDVEEARTDLEFKVVVTLNVKNGDGQFHAKEHEIYYRPITNEMLQLETAPALAAAITRWPFKEKPTVKVLSKRPQPFLNKIRDAIMSDYFPK